MRRYVLHAPVVLALLEQGRELPTDRTWLAPTLMRSEVLDHLYRAARGGRIADDEALDRLATFARMKIRYLGDKVLRRRAWSIAKRLGWDGTAAAEYLALTDLQADALVTLDAELAAAAATVGLTAVGSEALD